MTFNSLENEKKNFIGAVCPRTSYNRRLWGAENYEK